MNWRNYHLEDGVSKTTENVVLWKAEKGLVEIAKGSLAIGIKLGDENKGYVFHGDGRLLLDAIVETREGAVGSSVEKETAKPFLMLGRIEGNFSPANQEDFEKMGYSNQQEVLTKARDLLDRFLERNRLHCHHCSGMHHGLIFAFPGENGKFDLLVTNDSRIVYKSEGMVFVSDGRKSVLKSQKETVCVTEGKSVILNGCCVLSHSMCGKESL